MPQPPASSRSTELGYVLLTVQGSVLSSSVVKPRVTLNGQPVDASYGESRLTVRPGPWRVEASCWWLLTYGRAAHDVDVRPGEVVRLWYAPPWHQLSSGAIGTEPQRRKGALVLLVLVALTAVLGTLLSLRLG